MNRKTYFFVISAIAILILDIWTKQLVVEHIALYRGEVPLIPEFLSLVHVKNPGAAFGMLRDFEYRSYLFLGFTVIAFFIIADLWRKLPKNDWFLSMTMGFILSGAIGNAIDRVRYGEVTDFIKVYTEIDWLKSWLISTFGTNEWPSFNVADSALVVGACFFLIHYLFLEEREEENGEDKPKASA